MNIDISVYRTILLMWKLLKNFCLTKVFKSKETKDIYEYIVLLFKIIINMINENHVSFACVNDRA